MLKRESSTAARYTFKWKVKSRFRKEKGWIVWSELRQGFVSPEEAKDVVVKRRLSAGHYCMKAE